MAVKNPPEPDGFTRMMDQGGARPFVEMVNPDGTYQLSEEMKTVDRTLKPVDPVSRAIETEVKLLESEEAREELQIQLSHARKMESIGLLAGGVAHDFNNMLAVILGNAEMALEETSPDAQHAELKEILKATERSADLTRKLLAFVRKQIVAPKVLDVNESVEGMFMMLRRLIGEHIGLEWRPGSEAGQVKMDPSQIDQILVNLCVNARDAIGKTGLITIETEGVALDESACDELAGAIPGDYVRLAVSDDGCGMDPETQVHLFEPFFTTKGEGQGTGLGLATVYGIVRQNKGFISVASEIGVGTTFKIHLPRHVALAESEDGEDGKVLLERGHETILLVEDEPAIVNVVCSLLRRRGYAVLAAATPGEAIRLAKELSGGDIDLLITDVVMPEMDGRALHCALLATHPGLRCLFMSGHTADILARHGIFDDGLRFIQKPFAMGALAAMVREVLGGS